MKATRLHVAVAGYHLEVQGLLLAGVQTDD